jgi:hypothetical protein
MMPASLSPRAYKNALIISSLLVAAKAQQIGTFQSEVHPPLTWSTCCAGGSCTTTDGSIVLDSNWRWSTRLAPSLTATLETLGIPLFATRTQPVSRNALSMAQIIRVPTALQLPPMKFVSTSSLKTQTEQMLDLVYT